LLKTPIESATHGKLLIVIPKKSGNACKRNRFRRQAKSIFYEEKLYEKNSSFILLVYKEAVAMSFDQVKDFLVKNTK